VLDQNIDTGDATGRLLFNMLGEIGQFETEIRAERANGWHQESPGTRRRIWKKQETECERCYRIAETTH